MFDNLFKAAVGVVAETPVAIVVEVVTLGGSIAERDKPYTVEALEKVVQESI